MDLASAGIAVDLFDENERALARASARNEGKIHLGYVYAGDRSLRTARTMVKGALAFAPLLRRWLGARLDSIPVSLPFRYAVHAGGQLCADDVERHLADAHAIALEEGAGMPPDYFGGDWRVPPARLDDAQRRAAFDDRVVVAAFQTQEIAIDPEALAALVRDRLATCTPIRSRFRTRVRAAEPSSAGVVVDVETPEGRVRERYDHVVNALWHGRLAVDTTAGLAPERRWLYRVKHYARVRAPALAAVAPSTTIVLGPFGDIVAYANGDFYLSWYPAGMRGASSALSPPAWPLTLDRPASARMHDAIVAGLAGVVPAAARLGRDAVEACDVAAGIIFAWGETDIDDRSSGLHARYAIGPRSHGRYHSIDTGKLTMAPLFANAVADRIRAAG